MVTLPAIAILGAGSMGRAILNGLLAPSVQVDGDIRVTNRTETKAAALRVNGVRSFATETDPHANLAAVAEARIVVIAVKPAMVPAILDEIADGLEPDAIVVSVAAGVRASTIEARIPGICVIRAMPNTPALIGRAVTGLSAGSRCGEAELGLARTLFDTVGTVLEVPESRLDALSAISGSGPAYVFYLVEQLTAAAVGLGFSEAEAAAMVNGTFSGASELLVGSGQTPAELRRQVTSPQGTTERALAVLAEAELAELFGRAADAAIARAEELATGASTAQ